MFNLYIYEYLDGVNNSEIKMSNFDFSEEFILPVHVLALFSSTLIVLHRYLFLSMTRPRSLGSQVGKL